MENRLGKNRTSPRNEEDYINAYKEMNRRMPKNDLKDVSAVTTKDGIKGHGLLPQDINRSHDSEYHRVKNFIPDSELRKKFN